MRKTIAILLFLYSFCAQLPALQKCGIKANDGKDLFCQDGFSCSFGTIKNQLNCKCVGYVDNPFKRGAKYQIYSPCLKEDEINLNPTDVNKPVIANKTPGSGEIMGEKNAEKKKKIDLVRSFVLSGDSYYAAGEYDRAIEEWYKAISVDNESAIKLNPYIAKAYAKKGVQAYKKGAYESALINFNEALRLDPYNENIIRAKVRTESVLENISHNNNRFPANFNPQRDISANPSLKDFAPEKEDKTKNIFSIFRVIGWISIICFAFFLPWGKNILLSLSHLIVFFIINLFLPFLFAPAIVVSSLWVFFDSSKILKDIPYEERKKIFAFIVFPGGWTVSSLLFWPLFYPLYLSKRFDYREYKENKGNLEEMQKADDEKDKKEDIEKKKQVEDIRLLIKKGEYDKALKLLAGKTSPEIADYKFFLEIYIKIEDFIRAKLTFNKIMEKISAGVKDPEYEFYISMGNLCKHKKQRELAYELRKTAFEIMKEEIPINKNPGEFYTLAVNLENEGEYDLATEIYRYFEIRQVFYSDVSERLKKLREKKNSLPIYSQKIQENSLQIVGGHYAIQKILGSGGMGVVYQAKDERTGNMVAVKQIHSSLKEYPEEFKRFIREAEIVKKLKHPNIVSVLDVVEDGQETYLVFDYVDGKNLATILKEKVRLPLKECQEIIKDVCDALHYAHKNNIIHRDIKPANIMINSKGVVKIMDFGLACELRESMTRVTHQTMSGTPAYMAPEQYEGIVKKESDIYALGVCIYEMLTGELPFKTLDFQKDKKSQNYQELSSKLPWLSPAIDKIIDRALDPDPSMRYADAMDLWLDFKEIK